MDKAAYILMSLTVLLVVFGSALYVSSHVGWAQFLWVVASGTAGAGVARMVQ